MPRRKSPSPGPGPFAAEALSLKAANAVVLAALARAAYNDYAGAQAVAVHTKTSHRISNR